MRLQETASAAPADPVTLRELLRSTALATGSLLAVLALLEAGVRLFVAEGRWRFLDATEDWRLDPELGWVHRPDLDVASTIVERSVRFRTNPDGLIPASARREEAPETLRVMVFGDSMVVGRALPQDEIYTARLEAILRERGVRAEVINAGVQGYSTDQALLLMERWLPVYRPDVALYGSTFNDFGGNALDTANGQAKPRFELDGQGRLRLHPPRLAPEIRPQGSGVRRWIQNSALYRALQPGILVLRARLFGFHEKVLLGLYEDAYVRESFADRFDWRLYGALLGRMRQAAERAGARFLFFAHPEVGEVWEPYIERVCDRLGVPRSRYDPHAMERRLAAIAAGQRVEFVPLIEDFRAAQDRGAFHLLPYDPHLGPIGHALLAELLATRLAGAPSSADLAIPEASHEEPPG